MGGFGLGVAARCGLLALWLEAADAQCPAGDITVPDNGAFGTLCMGSGDDIPDAATCDLTCSTGYTLSDQPSCSGTSWSTTTATCTANTCALPTTAMAGYVLDSVACSGLQTGAILCETDPTCAAGYEGTPTESDYSCGAEGTELTIGGCQAIVCTQPSDITGYTVTEDELNVATGFAVTPLCATGYEGTPAVSPCTASGDYTLSGCQAIVCTQPSDITGYTVTEDELNVATGFAVTPLCATGYEGTPAVSPCTASGDYTLSGCQAIVCTQPSDITGYTVTEDELNVATGFAVTPLCATGYEGTPAVSPCTASGDYTLSGCQAIVCTQPSDITGYTVTEDELNVATGFAVTVECDADTHSEHGHDDVSATATACTTSGPYTLRGCTCTACVCVAPDTTGYEIIGSNLGGVGSVFDIHADTCAANYEGNPVVTPCGSDGEAYSVSGCQAIVCTQPSDITGYTVTDTELNVATGFAVTPLCATGYEGTPAVSPCTASGDYTLSGCQAIVCTQPSDITGYTVTEDELNVATGFAVTPLCAAGYEGTPAVSPCTASGDYTLSGCQQITCSGRVDPNTDYACQGANSHARSPPPVWDGDSDTGEATCCEPDVCTCANGVGAGSAEDQTGTTCTAGHGEALCVSCTGDFYLNSGTVPATCDAWTSCTSGQFESAAGTNTADRVCTPCTEVTNAVSDATYTCTSATTSRVSACASGFFLTTGADGAMDSCTAHNTCADSYVLTAGTGDADATCATCAPIDNAAVEATYTCTSATTSRVSACADSYWIDGSGEADTCAVCTTECASGQYQSAACAVAADTVCTDCDTNSVGNVIDGTTYTCVDALSTRIVNGEAQCSDGYQFVAGTDPDPTATPVVTGTPDHCGDITGLCYGNTDANTDYACQGANSHARSPSPVWGGDSDTAEATCCEPDVCTCANGVGAGSAEDQTGTTCTAGHGEALCVSCDAGFYLEGTACLQYQCNDSEPTPAETDYMTLNAEQDGCDDTRTTATCDAFTCAAGYEGGSITCNGDGTYTISPCTAIVCATLNTVPAGYVIADDPAPVLTAPDFAVTVSCADGYTADSPAATACAASGEEYTVTGCSANEGLCYGNADPNMDSAACDANTHRIVPAPEWDMTTQPVSQDICCEPDVCTCANGVGAGSAEDQTGTTCTAGHGEALCVSCDAGFYLEGTACLQYQCNDSEPTPAETDYMTLNAEQDGCDDTRTTATCDAFTCAAGYEGGSITCNGDGTYTISPCTAIVCATLNTVPAGYVIADDPAPVLTAPDFAVTVSCADGYTADSPAATACAASGEEYTVTGCSANEGLCYGNADPNMDSAACDANTHRIVPAPEWDMTTQLVSQDICCEPDVCTCANGVGAGSAEDQTGTTCTAGHGEALCASCTGDFYLNSGTDENSPPATCDAWTSCTSGQFESAAGTNTADRVCTPCTEVTNAVPDATYTCTSATTSRVSACASGFFLTTGADGAMDSCTAHNTCADSYVLTAGTGDADATCATCAPIDNAAVEATYTCTSATTSRVSACADSYWIDGSGEADTCAVCTTECASGQYQSAACAVAADTVCTDCDTNSVGNVIDGTTYTCVDALSTRIVNGEAQCSDGYQFVAGTDPDPTATPVVTGTPDHCGDITGLCYGNTDANTDYACQGANSHARSPSPVWGGDSDTAEATCCEPDVCTCANGVGAGSAEDQTGTTCTAGHGEALCVSCDAGFYLEGTACLQYQCNDSEPTPAETDYMTLNAEQDGCDDTRTTATCDAFTCAAGYEGGSITCNGDGTYTISPCTAIVCATLNTVPAGYVIADDPAPVLTAPDFAVTVSCADGYTADSPAATACAASGEEYTVTGCSANEGLCYGNADPNMDSAACDANTHRIVPAPEWDMTTQLVSQDICCEANVCTCANGVGAGSAEDQTETACAQHDAPYCVSCPDGLYLDMSGDVPECATCTDVADAASIESFSDEADAVLTCVSATSSRVTECRAGYFKTVGNDADADNNVDATPDTCTPWTENCAQGEFVESEGTGVSDIVCQSCSTVENAALDATYTCESASSSRVSSCLDGHTLIGGESGAEAEVPATSDTCEPNPCLTTDSIMVRIDSNATNTQAETGQPNETPPAEGEEDQRVYEVAVSPESQLLGNGNVNGWVPCTSLGNGNEFSGAAGVELSCSLGVLTVVSEDCVPFDGCSAEEDNCWGLGDNGEEHLCVQTGAGTHDCRCLAGAYGTAQNPLGLDNAAGGDGADADDSSQTACTACPANSISAEAAREVTECACAAGFGVDGDGANQAVVGVDTVCAAVPCPVHSAGNGGGDSCTCETGYTGDPVWSSDDNTYGADACTTCDQSYWKDMTTDNNDCVACSVCEDGSFQDSECAAEADTVCTACTEVADAATNATYTCASADSSRISACRSGFFKTVGNDYSDGGTPDDTSDDVAATSDTCMACTECAEGYFQASACTADADAVCTACTEVADAAVDGDSAADDGLAATYTCASADSSRISACRSGFFKTVGNDYSDGGTTDDTSDDVAATSDTCTACTECAEGYFQASACTADADAVCTACTEVADAAVDGDSAADDGLAATYTCASADSSRISACRSGFFKTVGNDYSDGGTTDDTSDDVAATSDTCTACTECAEGYFQASACTADADAVCTACTEVADAAVDGDSAADDGLAAAYTCASADSSRISACRSGFFKTVGNDYSDGGTTDDTSDDVAATSDTCTACTPVENAIGSDTPDDATDDATYTCASATSSRVSACRSGYSVSYGRDYSDGGTVEDPSDDITESSDTCVAGCGMSPIPFSISNPAPECTGQGHQGGAGFVQACQGEAGCEYSSGQCTLIPISGYDIMSDSEFQTVQCNSWRPGHVGDITLTCNVGVVEIVNNTCSEIDHCEDSTDDCWGLGDNGEEHLCVPTGAGTHDCRCLAGAYGTAQNPLGLDNAAGGDGADADDSSQTACTACPANSISAEAAREVTECACAAGFGVDGDGANQAVVGVDTVCAAVPCPVRSAGNGGGDSCTCETGYTGDPVWSSDDNTYGPPSCAFPEGSTTDCPEGCVYVDTEGEESCTAPDAPCTVCDGNFWKDMNTDNNDCVACSVCEDGFFQGEECAAEADTVCTACSVVGNAAVDGDSAADDALPATYTCASADSSRISACRSGFFKTVGNDYSDGGTPDDTSDDVAATSDTCTACTECAEGFFVDEPCSATSDTVCTPCTPVENSIGSDTPGVTTDDILLTCTSASSSRLDPNQATVCLSSFVKVEAADDTTADVCACAGNQHPESLDQVAICDLDISTDGSAVCPFGCEEGDEAGPECSMTTDGCPAGCTTVPESTIECAFADGTTGCPTGCTEDLSTAGSETCTGGAIHTPESCEGESDRVPTCTGQSTQQTICVDNVCTCNGADGSSYGTAATAADNCTVHDANICNACESLNGWRCTNDECGPDDSDRGCEPSCVCESGGIPTTSCSRSDIDSCASCDDSDPNDNILEKWLETVAGTDEVTCSACSNDLVCAPGQGFSACTETADAACSACADGQAFQAEADSTAACTACGDECPVGTYLSSPCVAEADRVCTNCTLPENAQLADGVTYTCVGNETAVASAEFPEQSLTLTGGVEVAGGDGTSARAAFEESFKTDLATKLADLGLDVDPKYIQITGVVLGSIRVEYIILAPIASFENATAALTSIAEQAAAGTLGSIGGTSAASAQDPVVEPDMSSVPSPCKKGFSLVSGVCTSMLCGEDERVLDNECVPCDDSVREFHAPGALQGFNDTQCTPACAVVLHDNGVMGDCDSILKVGSSCTLGCQEGFEFVDRMKRTGPAGLGARIKVPRHPYCRESREEEFMSELQVDVECVEEASLLGVFIILVVMVLIPTAIAAAKYFRQFADYKKKVARGYKWDGKGNAIAPNGEQDVMDVERTAGSMEETSNPVAEGADEYEMET